MTAIHNETNIAITNTVTTIGTAIAADLVQGGFDSHEDNDPEQEIHLNELTEGIDFLWDSAEAAGIADRLVVVIGSDFSRAPFYTSSQGKASL